MYQSQIEYLSESDSEYVLKNIFRLSRWKDIKLEHSMRWWLVLSIWREAVQMENKARAKKWEKRLEIDDATLMGDTVETVKVENVRPSNIKSSQVKSSNIKESNIVVSSEIIETKVSTLQEIIKNTFSLEFITEVYNKYSMSKEEFKEECELFDWYWNATLLKWRDKWKPRWEGEKTFDAKLRFRTWIKNNDKWSNRVIINSEDEERRIKLEEIERLKKIMYNKK